MEDYDGPNAKGGDFPDNVNARYVTVTSGDPSKGWAPTSGLCRITRTNRYGLDDASAQYTLRANEVILDHVDLDMSKITAITSKANGAHAPYLTLANCNVADPYGPTGPLNGSFLIPNSSITIQTVFSPIQAVSSGQWWSVRRQPKSPRRRHVPQRHDVKLVGRLLFHHKE